MQEVLGNDQEPILDRYNVEHVIKIAKSHPVIDDPQESQALTREAQLQGIPLWELFLIQHVGMTNSENMLHTFAHRLRNRPRSVFGESYYRLGLYNLALEHKSTEEWQRISQNLKAVDRQVLHEQGNVASQLASIVLSLDAVPSPDVNLTAGVEYAFGSVAHTRFMQRVPYRQPESPLGFAAGYGALEVIGFQGDESTADYFQNLAFASRLLEVDMSLL
jgi:hypothetical protein